MARQVESATESWGIVVESDDPSKSFVDLHAGRETVNCDDVTEVGLDDTSKEKW